MSQTLMVSVSGMRGIVGTDLTPELVARHAAALGAWARAAGKPLVVLGRDARTRGPMFARAAAAGLMSAGADVVDLGITTTPTAQLAVEFHRAGAGLILTASHNPIEWNALKFVGPDGVFLDGAAGAQVRALAEQGPPRTTWEGIGSVREDPDAVRRHLDLVLGLPLIDREGLRRRRFRVALDCVRGAGGVAMPALLEALGCEVHAINLATDGRFPRPPEPLPENLGELGALVREVKADIGMAVDPDVDRLALVDEQGRAIGEDYTLAFAVRAVLGAGGRTPAVAGGAATVVANLSTSLVVEDAARAFGARFLRAPVGEANVARTMIAERAVIGGEGNGGVMLPALHVGRDAPAGAALVLQYLLAERRAVSDCVAAAPRYFIVKAKAPRGPDLAPVYAALRTRFPDAQADVADGLRLSWPDRWVHARPSGTEPIVRFIAEAPTAREAEGLVDACRSAFAGQ
ncbi:MAG TPA: phosphoglucosamine mutase [Gemmatimonadales bacterium]|nr:phosphoglucosamine mutase [Gemmatimonadales bacterium]